LLLNVFCHDYPTDLNIVLSVKKDFSFSDVVYFVSGFDPLFVVIVDVEYKQCS
jgi:hypothetical protein